MKGAPVRVAVLWHMHQPYYRDTVSGRSFLPWARLHAVKDYLPMAVILKEHPGVHAVINFVPSLIKQILEYTEAGLRDDFWDATATPAADLADRDRVFLLRNFFMANWNLAIKPAPRYGELLEKRGYQPTAKELERASALYSVQDFLDLQVWFNLVWFHPLDTGRDEVLAGMLRRGRNFTEEEKKYVLDKQIDLMKQVVPLHRELAARGQVELSTSPFYHPILPLLVDSESAHEAMPGLPLPSPPFRRREDAALQLSRAVEYHTQVFGRRPEGLWPSEGSVSEEVAALVMEQGFAWMASDEEVLYRSMGMELSARTFSEEQRCDRLYHPYRLERRDKTLAMVFRDHVISDAIGFSYGHWEPRAAAADLLRRLEVVGERCSPRNPQPLVTVILDGENPWEYYREQGLSFLRSFYEGLERSTRLRAVTVAEALSETPPREQLPRLFAGSWINHNFQIWIGHPEDRRAWELLARARGVLDDPGVELDEEVRRQALEEILIAEGSDWCWWYGDENASGNDEAFDELYRRHLQNVFALAGRQIPDEYKVTIFTGKRVLVPLIRIYSFIEPVIDGRVSSYFEWLAAGEYPIDQRGGAMHRADWLLTAIYFGFNLTHLFVRLDPAMKLMANDLTNYMFNLHILRPRKLKLEITADGNRARVRIVDPDGEGREGSAEGVAAALQDVLEIAIPFALLGARTGDRIEFFVSLARQGGEVGHWPHQGYLSADVPPADFEEKTWSI